MGHISQAGHTGRHIGSDRFYRTDNGALPQRVIGDCLGDSMSFSPDALEDWEIHSFEVLGKEFK